MSVKCRDLLHLVSRAMRLVKPPSNDRAAYIYFPRDVRVVEFVARLAHVEPAALLPRAIFAVVPSASDRVHPAHVASDAQVRERQRVYDAAAAR